FTIVRRRNRQWIERTAKWLAEEGYVDQANNLIEILKEKPQGTQPYQYDKTNDVLNFRSNIATATGSDHYFDDIYTSESKSSIWEIIEEWVPGENPVVRMAVDENLWIGEIPSPYDLDGKIPFTELVFIDNLLGGVGDSTARIMRGL